MNDETLLRILRHEDTPVRKAASLKCVRALPLKRLRRLLIEYTAGDDTQYYNVIHWLDLGVSVAKVRATKAAGRELEDTWPAKVPAA